MTTRAAAARAAALIDSSLIDQSCNHQSLSDTPKLQPTSGQRGTQRGDEILNQTMMQPQSLLITGRSTKNRSNTTSRSTKRKRVRKEEVVKGGWDVLPHNMGGVDIRANDGHAPILPPKKRSRVTATGPKNLESTRPTNKSQIDSHRSGRGNANKPNRSPLKMNDYVEEDALMRESKNEVLNEVTVDKSGSKDLGRPPLKVNSLGVKLGETGKPKSRLVSIKDEGFTSDEIEAKVSDVLQASDKPLIKTRKGKKNPYGLTPGESPFPNFVMPTVEACKIVNDLLSQAHGKVEPPKTVPPPSLQITGCGEVPSVLDALIRTRLSAATTGTNAAYAFAGLVKRYGVREEGIGKGSVDWNKVREGDVEGLEEAIKRGGLAKSKSVSIKAILEMVHEQNVARHDAFVKEKEGGKASEMVGSDRLEQGQKDLEIAVADQHILSLDYMHGLTVDEAMSEFTKFPGIGVKTASCVILFCLQRPSFAVDTHVWRMCKWLKWVPDGATRDQTFSHIEVRVPDDMKYSLHQLFIRHGKTCGRCRAATGETSEAWTETVCPIEKLVERTGKRKGMPGKKPVTTKISKAKAKAKVKSWDEDEDDTTEADQPDLDIDEESNGGGESDA